MSKHEIIPVIQKPVLEDVTSDKELESVLKYTESAMWDATTLGMQNAGQFAPIPRLVITDADEHRYVINKIVTKHGRCELHVEKCCLKPSTPETDAEEEKD